MPIAVEHTPDSQLVIVRVSGTLTTNEYRRFVPEFERAVRGRDKIRILFDMLHFSGWEPGAAWQDLKLTFRHLGQMEKVAMVGDKKWQELMTEFGRLFTAAEVRYFDHVDIEAARQWLQSD